jgi:hypothetical protein
LVFRQDTPPQPAQAVLGNGSVQARVTTSEVGKLLAVTLSGLLIACVNSPRLVSETPPRASYSFVGETQLDEARRKADDYCRRFNLDARLVDVD